MVRSRLVRLRSGRKLCKYAPLQTMVFLNYDLRIRSWQDGPKEAGGEAIVHSSHVHPKEPKKIEIRSTPALPPPLRGAGTRHGSICAGYACTSPRDVGTRGRSRFP